jgi:hypothetical protein
MSTYCAQWNKELLFVAGLTLRSVYESEMEDIAKVWKARSRTGSLDETTREELKGRALFIMNFFAIDSSTPSATVGTTIESSFFSSPGKISIMSSLGPLSTGLVRLPNPQLVDFYQGSTLDDTMASTGLGIGFKSRGLVKDISLEDVISDLGSHTLDNDAAIACLKCVSSLASASQVRPLSNEPNTEC